MAVERKTIEVDSLAWFKLKQKAKENNTTVARAAGKLVEQEVSEEEAQPA